MRSFKSTITYRPQFRQLKMIIEDLENITPGWTKNGHGESHTLLNDAYLIRLASHLSELSGDLQSAQLRHCNHNQNFVLIYMFFLRKIKRRLSITAYRWENHHRRYRKLCLSLKHCTNTHESRCPDAFWDPRHRTEYKDLR